jgi:cell wall-associated NlpC family hydrolase
MKKYLLYGILFIYCVLMGACNWFEVRKTGDPVVLKDSLVTLDSATAHLDTVLQIDTVQTHDRFPQDGTRNRDTALLPPSQKINTARVQPHDVVQFAQTLIGTPYVYASTNPKVGFDCSGFITYVFNHFGIAVPRSSVDFTNVGKTVPVAEARPGDLILFTGTDSTEKQVGHMGLVVTNDNDLQFIHSTSGKAMGVTITPLNDYYKKRFVRIARIFPENELAMRPAP